MRLLPSVALCSSLSPQLQGSEMVAFRQKQGRDADAAHPMASTGTQPAYALSKRGVNNPQLHVMLQGRLATVEGKQILLTLLG